MKKRLDVLLVEKGFFESREKAKAVIMSGCVYVNNQKADKAGSSYDENASVEVRDNRMRYVSRGGYKLEKAMEVFPISLDGKVTMDIGASTGGFTDCMLQNGAKKVYAVDVGYGQLAWKLRNDERVVNLERTNMRYVTCEQVPEAVDFFSVDVAFISLKLILPAARGVCADDAQVFRGTCGCRVILRLQHPVVCQRRVILCPCAQCTQPQQGQTGIYAPFFHNPISNNAVSARLL